MRIDTGLSSYYSSGRAYHERTGGDDLASDADAVTKPRSASNPAISSTLLSPSLASALWDVEGGRGFSRETADLARLSAAEKVEAVYLEYTQGEA